MKIRYVLNMPNRLYSNLKKKKLMNFIDIILKLYIGHKYNTFIIRGTAGNFQSEKKTKQPSEMMLNPWTPP